ncbi:MAG TPA: YdcF family protein [Terracidiphilus sp.]|nr:YdcF family protein [Terracidiphilus sp.]
MALVAWAMVARAFAPASNTSLTRFDAIIVLGYKADADGNPTPEQLARTTEGVREYERDVAPRLIFTGGAAHNAFVEAQVMARTAEAQGIPASAIFIEPEAKDTIQNACYAARIMKAHGWRSAEVVTSASHLPRAGLIFNRLPIAWRGHAAPPLEPPTADLGAASALETLKTVRYLAYADWAERCEP